MELYIDPGTGSMLFAILIGIVGAVNFAFRSALVKIKFVLSGGKAAANDRDAKPDFVIFSDDKRYWNVFQPLCREMSARGIEVDYLTASQDDPALTCELAHVNAKFIGEGNTAFAKLNTMRASILLSTTPGLDVFQWKRSPEIDCYVHLFHTVGEAQLYRMFGIDYYDAVLASGTAQAEGVTQLEDLRSLPPKDVALVGAPYMDAMAARLAASTPQKHGEKTVLLAPTWGKSGIFGVHGDKILAELLATGYHIIVRPHPQSFVSEADLIAKLQKRYPDSDQLEWNRDNDNFEVLRRSDILISDFSGIVFEFAFVYDKPVIYANATIDVAPYDAWWLLPEKTWTERALPAIGLELESSLEGATLKEVIDRCLEDPAFALSRQALRDEAWCHRGNGAQQVVDYLVAKNRQIQSARTTEEAQPASAPQRTGADAAGERSRS